MLEARCKGYESSSKELEEIVDEQANTIEALEAKCRDLQERLGESEQMDDDSAISLVMQEVKRARAKHPNWPTDVLEATAIISEESGEAIREALQIYQGEMDDESFLTKEVIQTAAVCIRFLTQN